MSDTSPHPNYLAMTAEIVSAHVEHNAMPADDLPDLIRSVYASLTAVGRAGEAAIPDKPQPAVPAKRSVFPNYIVCLEDGKRLQMLKRYLKTRYNMTPAQYRQRWGLADNYPMVAPNYAIRRSEIAKSAGLGRVKAAAVKIEPEAVVPEPKVTRGRARRAKGARG